MAKGEAPSNLAEPGSRRERRLREGLGSSIFPLIRDEPFLFEESAPKRQIAGTAPPPTRHPIAPCSLQLETCSWFFYFAALSCSIYNTA